MIFFRYKSDFDEDCKIIKKCKEAVKKELTGIQNKIDKFLQANKPVELNENCSLTSYQSAENDCFCELSLEDFILHELKLIEKQIDSFDFWRTMLVKKKYDQNTKLRFYTNIIFRILKNMASYRSFMEKETFEVVDTWQEELILERSQFVDENLKTVEELREDIRNKAYNVRSNELTMHQKKIERHKQVVF